MAGTMTPGGYWDWFLSDPTGMVDRFGQGAVPNAQEPAVALAQARLEAARRGPTLPAGAAPPPYGPGPTTLPSGAVAAPQGGLAPMPGPPSPADAAFLGLGQPGAGDAEAPPASTMFGQSLSGAVPDTSGTVTGSAVSDWIADQLGTLTTGGQRLGQAWMDHAAGWDPILRFFDVDPQNPLGLGGGDASAAPSGLTPLEQALAELRAGGGGGTSGVAPGGAGGGASGGYRGGNAVGGGSGLSYDLGPVRLPPPVPTRALPNAPDISGVLAEIEGSGPRPYEPEERSWTDALGAAAAAVSQLGPRADIGDILLAAGAGMAANKQQDKREDKREQRYWDEQQREHKLRVADAKLKGVELGSEFEQKRADVEYNNRLGEWKREAAILEATQPQAQMTSAGMLIQDVDPKTGNRRVRVDTAPIDHLLEGRMALKALGAGPGTLSSFTGSQINPDSPEQLALKWALDLSDSPDMWAPLYGDKFAEFQAELEQSIGKDSAFGAYASNLTGKEGNAHQGAVAQRALVRLLQRDIMNNPLLQQRFLALQGGRIPEEAP